MQREYFGEGLQNLDDTSFARCVVIAGAVSGPLVSWLEGRSEPSAVEAALARALGDTRDPTLRVRLASVKKLADLWLSAPVRQRFLDALPALWAAGPGARPVALVVSGGPAKLDRVWLATALSAAGDVRSVMFESAQPGAGKWEWPLRIGVPATQAGYQLQAALHGVFGDLQQVEVLDAQDAIVDLLLLPDPLPYAQDLVSSGRVMADAVLVLGHRDEGPGQAMADLEALMQRYRGGLVGSVIVTQDHWRGWFEGLMRELAHNQSLPDVIFRRHEFDRSPARVVPLLFGDTDFVASTRTEDAAARLARTLETRHTGRLISIDPGLLSHLQLDPATRSADELARQLKARLPHFQWQREDHETRGMVQLRQALEDQLGRLDTRAPRARTSPPKMSAPPDWAGPVEMAPSSPAPDDGFAMSPPPEEMAESAPPPDDEMAASAPPPDDGVREPRHVQARFHAMDAAKSRLATLPAATDCWMRVHVGVPRGDGATVAPVALDEDLLPDSTTGHDLSLVYCPLSAVDDGEGGRAIPPPVLATVHLPNTGDSDVAAFSVRCGADRASFRARLIVLHQNRVLQTLLLTCSADGRPALTPENAYAPGLTSPSADVPADVAFVINDDPQGEPALAGVAEGRPFFHEPEGLKETLKQMKRLLTGAVVAAAGDPGARIDAEANVMLMRRLANYGALLLEAINSRQVFQTLETADRVQVVEAVRGAYFPVEFLYSGLAPRADAALCPNAQAALGAPDRGLHRACPHRQDRGFVCPAAFWGFDKCIERLPTADLGVHRLTEPVPGDETLGPFTSALVAGSARAASQMSGPQGLPATVEKHVASVTAVGSWSDWGKRIADRRPDLLVLMPHTEDSSFTPGIPTLEVSDDALEAGHLDSSFVRAAPPPAKGPLVMLLGCSTKFSEIPFLNFVERFSQQGAPIVIGTLSVIHSTQAALLAEHLLAAIAAPQHQAQRFDEALLKVRRELLAAGNSVAFTLMSYGHSSWRI